MEYPLIGYLAYQKINNQGKEKKTMNELLEKIIYVIRSAEDNKLISENASNILIEDIEDIFEELKVTSKP